MFKKLLLIFFIPFVFLSYGCEKEIGDTIIPENFNPHEGNYIFTITSQISGSHEMYVNNRGNFSFFVTLSSGPGSEGYSVVITGHVNSNGNLEGTVFHTQLEVGYVRGELGGGDFYLNDNGYVLIGHYGSSLN
jgi:hypothetical protein